MSRERSRMVMAEAKYSQWPARRPETKRGSGYGGWAQRVVKTPRNLREGFIAHVGEIGERIGQRAGLVLQQVGAAQTSASHRGVVGELPANLHRLGGPADGGG